MKTFLVTLLLSISSIAFGDLGTPVTTVETVIRSAQNNKTVALNLDAVAKDPKNAHTKESLLLLLKGIDPEKVVFEAMDKKRNIYWFADKVDPNKSLVRILEPVKLEFEVMFVKDDTIGCGGYFEVVAVNP